jgi:hypothetical protein
MDIQVGISNNFEVVTLNNRVQSLILQILQKLLRFVWNSLLNYKKYSLTINKIDNPTINEIKYL